MSLEQTLESYLELLRSLGARLPDHLKPSATASELQRLHDYLEGDVPDSLLEWYQISAGIDYDAHFQDISNYIRTYLFPAGEFWSIDDAIAYDRELWPCRTVDNWLPRRAYPFVGSGEGGTAMFMECTNNDGRVASFDIEDNNADGFFHQSIEDFIIGSHHVVEQGKFTLLDNDNFIFVQPDSRVHEFGKLTTYGFRLDQTANGPNQPPRLPVNPPTTGPSPDGTAHS